MGRKNDARRRANFNLATTMSKIVSVVTTLVVCGFAVLYPASVKGCGISWHPPQGAFYPVADDGYIQAWFDAGKLNLKSGFLIPVFVEFTSKAIKKQGLLGDGWICPLLESKIVQVQEDEFELLQPDGEQVRLKRAKYNSNTIAGPGWAGTIETNSIEIRASCGWRIRYVNGTITNLDSPNGDHLAYEYVNSKLKSITQDGEVILKVEEKPDDQLVLAGRGLNVSCALVVHPQFSVVDNHPVVVSMSKILSTLKAQDLSLGCCYKFDDHALESLAVDDLSETHTYRWHLEDGRVASIDQYSYVVDAEALAKGGYKIERYRDGSKLVSDLFAWNPGTGVEQHRIAGGPLIVTTHFVGGMLAGKIRKVERIGSGGDAHAIEKFIYDQKGQTAIAWHNNIKLKVENSTKEISVFDMASGQSLAVNYDEHDQITSIVLDKHKYSVVSKQSENYVLEGDEDHLNINLPASSLAEFANRSQKAAAANQTTSPN